MKNRPRDFNIVALVKEFDINSFGISNTEISCLLASSSDSGIVIVMASISGHVYRISLDLSYNFLRSESIFIGEIVEDMLFPKRNPLQKFILEPDQKFCSYWFQYFRLNAHWKIKPSARKAISIVQQNIISI